MEKKRGRGRPKKGVLNLAEERAKVQAGIKASQERHGIIDFPETEEALETMLSEDKLKACTRSEMKELRRMAERLWDKFQIEKEYAEDQAWEGGYGAKRELTPEMEAWDAEHEFLQPKRKNAKKTKSIYDLTDRQKEKKGMALKPQPIEIDIDATEAELENKLIQQAKLAHEESKHFLTGRRVSGRAKHDPNKPARKSFWV